MKNKKLPILFLACSFFGVLSLNAQKNERILKDYITKSSIQSYKKGDLNNFKIEGSSESKSLKGEILQVQQTYNDLPIYNAVATAIIKDGKVAYLTDTFQKDYKNSPATSAKIDAKVAFSKIAADLKLKDSYALIDFGAQDLNENFAKYRKVYFQQGENLVLAYEFMFPEKDVVNYWNILVDASTGQILAKNDLNLSCSFDSGFSTREFDSLEESASHELHNHSLHSASKTFDAQLESAANFVAGADNASYRVYKLPIEAPNFGDRTLVSNPWDLTASPYGWHDDNTTKYTITRGNNAFAYTDLNSNNSIGNSAQGGASRIFDFPINLDAKFGEYENAAITNLFYMNNMMHDIFYKFGFQEANKNFQAYNFGKGGAQGDYVLAEARDGGNLLDNSKLNNANFSTPEDGSRPRMQMYLWSPKIANRVFYNTPIEFKDRKPNTTYAAYGPALTATGITGDLAFSAANGCTAVSTNYSNKIVVVSAAGCSFAIKTKEFQNAGAIGVVMYHPSSNTPINMGGADATVTIPSVMIGLDEGTFLRNEIQTKGTAVNATLKYDKFDQIYIDGDLDNGIIAHEYGHGISNRLTGTGYSCLSYNYANEQMGEGWSDFFALLTTNQPGDTADTPRSIGSFASGQDKNGAGIRPAKYSPNFAINNYTYGKTNGLSTVNSAGTTVPHVHSIGFIWASMLWDLHWKYVEKYGYASDVAANPQSGSGKVLQLVLDGIKLQGCDPNFVTGRNAIIQADQQTTGGENKCLIWSVFAKRGLGVNANPGLTVPVSYTPANVIAAISDQVEDFTIPTECTTLGTTENDATKLGASVYPNPAKNEFFVSLNSKSVGKTLVEVYDASGKLVTSQKVDASSKESISTANLSNGVYVVKVSGVGVNYSSKLIVNK